MRLWPWSAIVRRIEQNAIAAAREADAAEAEAARDRLRALADDTNHDVRLRATYLPTTYRSENARGRRR